MAGLTAKQKRFCEEYIIDLNATAAYGRAGYAVAKDVTAAKNGHKLLKNTDIQAYIAYLQALRSKRTEVTADRIIEELAAIAFHRVSSVVSVKDDIAHVQDSDKWSEESRAAVSEVQGECTETTNDKGVTVVGRVKLKTHDKMRALELLAKITGLTSDFDAAIAALKNYGIVIKHDAATGKYFVE
jgi:phage terminase small subunit